MMNTIFKLMDETTSQADRVKSGLWGIPGMNDAKSETPTDRRGWTGIMGKEAPLSNESMEHQWDITANRIKHSF